MLQRNQINRSWVRGNLNPGSKHQKHVSLVPTKYLYRFPSHPTRPGPIIMKYYWTLGCMPTGLDTPFRLKEFQYNYIAQHVPEEVEEWLRRHVVDPVEKLENALADFMDAMNKLPNAIAGVGYTTALPMVNTALPQLEAFGQELGIQVPAICLRGVASDRHLKERALDDLFEYRESIAEFGSTPHRRAMRALLEDVSKEKGNQISDLFLPNLNLMAQIPTSSTSSSADDDAQHQISAVNAESNIQVSEQQQQSGERGEGNPSDELAPYQQSIAASLRVDDTQTAIDERAIIRLLTTFGEGAMKTRKYDAAATVLESALLFAHDDDCRATVHSNLATACNQAGEYKSAEHNAREAVLLNHSKKAFANLGVALAYQQREDEALSVMKDALEIYKGDENLKMTQAQIMSFASAKPAAGSLAAAAVGAASNRYYSNTSRTKVLGNGFGNNFGNQFDTVSINGKQTDAKLNPMEFGTTFKRAHIAGLAYRTSTKTVERN